MVHGVVARSARWRMGTGIAGGADAHIPGGMDDLAVSGGALPACYHAAPNGAYSQKDQGSPRPAQSRSDERRVGKECVRTCRSRWSQDHLKQKETGEQASRATIDNS